MLERLCIRNYALIEHLDLDFHKGFTVISGETGSGKSTMLAAFFLLLGSRADVQSIRTGCDSAEVSATFQISDNDDIRKFLDERDIDYDDTIDIRRVLKSSGRSTAYVNGAMIPKADLTVLSSYLVDISAQHNHQSLLSCDRQRQLLDSYGDYSSLLDDFSSSYHSYCSTLRELDEARETLATSLKEEDYLSFALNEIEQIDPKEGEDDQIKETLDIISRSGEIYEDLERVSNCIKDNAGGGVIPGLYESSKTLSSVSDIDQSLSGYAERLESAMIEIDDIYQSIRDYVGHMNFSEEELDRLNSRMMQLQRLKKKYGPSLNRVMEYRAEIERKLQMCSNGEEAVAELERKTEDLLSRCNELSARITLERKKCAEKLGHEIEKNLRDLGMPRCVFEIVIEKCAMTQDGCDRVEFSLCANPGLEIRSIRDIASGGELSRVMLAIKVVLCSRDNVDTLFFDEVDAGIGGAVANSVAVKLKELSKTRQVISITHLASIAKDGDRHLLVEKHVEDGTTFSDIRYIKDDERVQEIARMLSGDLTQESMEHARSLLSHQATLFD